MKTVASLPPEIKQHFDYNLLQAPTLGMKEPKYYRKWYGDQIYAKYVHGSKHCREYEEIMKVYEELYEWKKAQEAYRDDKEAKERPIVPAEGINRLLGKLGKDVRESFYSAGLLQGSARRRCNEV